MFAQHFFVCVWERDGEFIYLLHGVKLKVRMEGLAWRIRVTLDVVSCRRHSRVQRRRVLDHGPQQCWHHKERRLQDQRTRGGASPTGSSGHHRWERDVKGAARTGERLKCRDWLSDVLPFRRGRDWCARCHVGPKGHCSCAAEEGAEFDLGWIEDLGEVLWLSARQTFLCTHCQSFIPLTRVSSTVWGILAKKTT